MDMTIAKGVEAGLVTALALGIYLHVGVSHLRKIWDPKARAATARAPAIVADATWGLSLIHI